MNRPLALRVLLLLLAGLGALRAAPGVGAGEPAAGPGWSEWAPETFERARKEGRLLVVEVSAAWCHWCHVMETKTYADPRVLQVLRERFLPVKVDADARPDLAERYAEYHWPATIFLTPDAKEIAAVRGYRDPEAFLRILSDVALAARDGRSLMDPSSALAAASAPSTAAPDALSRVRARWLRTLGNEWDKDQAGWGSGQKYPYAPALLHAVLEARLTDSPSWRQMVVRTLTAWEALIDPVWGGMYQYSEGGTWSSPHFEKIMAVQAGAIAAYAEGFRLTHDQRWLRDAYAVRRFLVTKLRSPTGAFYTSQDADLGGTNGLRVDGATYFARDEAGRRQLGMPRIDQAVYAQENGWAVQALCTLHDASLDLDALAQAKAAATRILATHRDASGLFRHAERDGGVLHLGDQVAMAHAMWALWQSTGERAWLAEAERTAGAMLERFLDARNGGFFANTEDATATGVFAERVRPFEVNAQAARLLLVLHVTTENPRYRAEALRALAALGASGAEDRLGWRVGIGALAVEEALYPWTHAAVIGIEGDGRSDALWAGALLFDAPLLVRERLMPGQKSAAGGTSYPLGSGSALYFCGGGKCSPPVLRVEDLPTTWAAFRK